MGGRCAAWLWVGAGTFMAGIAALPWELDRGSNPVFVSAPEASENSRRLHAELTVVDLHADSLLWNRDLSSEWWVGHLDLPRLRSSNVGLQVFSAVTQVPMGSSYSGTPSNDYDLLAALVVVQRWPVRTWSSAFERAAYQAEKLDALVRDSAGGLHPVLEAEDLEILARVRSERRDVGAAPIGVLLALEGMHAIEGNLENLDRLFAMGFRVFGLAHFFDNRIAGSAHGQTRGGLTPLGVRAVSRIEELGGIVDIAHCSEQTIADVLAVARKPVLVSHSGVFGTCATPRTLKDAQLDAIARAGGVIGIGLFPGAICGEDPRAVAQAIRYAIDRVGPTHVALGSDFDGGVATVVDAGHWVAITDALLDAGLSPAEVRAVMGENALRFFETHLKRLRGSSEPGRENDADG